jgi:hypothetical protein
LQAALEQLSDAQRRANKQLGLCSSVRLADCCDGSGSAGSAVGGSDYSSGFCSGHKRVGRRRVLHSAEGMQAVSVPPVPRCVRHGAPSSPCGLRVRKPLCQCVQIAEARGQAAANKLAGGASLRLAQF